MRNSESQNNAPRRLYPVIQPYRSDMLDVGDGHRVYYEECGNPNGVPVVVLHGGPGGGCSPGMRRFFHPDTYRIILFDQRGCGRSKPSGSVTANTTWDLVADIELLRILLGIDQWIVFGGSWGATLALIYAQTHPEHTQHLVLRGVFLMTEAELDWFYNGGAARFYPEEWERFLAPLPADEHDDIIGGFHRRLFGNDAADQTVFARAWTEWESSLASLSPQSVSGSTPAAYARTFARIENHYFTNKGFLEEDGQIIRDMHKIASIPGTIVQGRYDMICPPYKAFELNKAWPASRIIIAQHSGHSLSEDEICSALVRVMDELA